MKVSKYSFQDFINVDGVIRSITVQWSTASSEVRRFVDGRLVQNMGSVGTDLKYPYVEMMEFDDGNGEEA